MADFNFAHKFSALWEGGLTNHPNDPGGITNHGVSLRWLRSLGPEYGDIDGDGDIDADDIRALTKEQAAVLFRQKFWDAYKLSELPEISAAAHYDCVMNTGPKQATLITQRACNCFVGPYGDKLAVDGAFGPLTKLFLKSWTTKALVTKMIDLRVKYYRDLCAAKPKYRPFEKGWYNRCNDLRRYLGLLKSPQGGGQYAGDCIRGLQ